MSRSYIELPSGILVDAELKSIAGISVLRQTVEPSPPRPIIRASQTRPNDTTAYTANDAVSNSTSSPVAITFSNMARYNGGGGIIKKALLHDQGNQATRGEFELWLFEGSAAPTATNDNAAFSVLNVPLEKIVGVITFAVANAFVGASAGGSSGNNIYHGTLGASERNLDIPYKCDDATTSLFGLMVVRNAYTPLANEVFRFSLFPEQE